MLTKIINVEDVSPKVLQLQFNVDWTMDDTNAIIDHLVQVLSAIVLERIQGADLYCVRMKVGHHEFLLNFEEYSHACWFECVTEQDISGLQNIKRVLS